MDFRRSTDSTVDTTTFALEFQVAFLLTAGTLHVYLSSWESESRGPFSNTDTAEEDTVQHRHPGSSTAGKRDGEALRSGRDIPSHRDS